MAVEEVDPVEGVTQDVTSAGEEEVAVVSDDQEAAVVDLEEVLVEAGASEEIFPVAHSTQCRQVVKTWTLLTL